MTDDAAMQKLQNALDRARTDIRDKGLHIPVPSPTEVVQEEKPPEQTNNPALKEEIVIKKRRTRRNLASRFDNFKPMPALEIWALVHSTVQHWLDRISYGSFGPWLDYTRRVVPDNSPLRVCFSAAPGGLTIPRTEVCVGKVQLCSSFEPVVCEERELPLWSYEVPWQGMAYVDQFGNSHERWTPPYSEFHHFFLVLSKFEGEPLYVPRICRARNDWQGTRFVCRTRGYEEVEVKDFLAWLPLNVGGVAGAIRWKYGMPPEYLEQLLVFDNGFRIVKRAGRLDKQFFDGKSRLWSELPLPYGRLTDEVDTSAFPWFKTGWRLKDAEVQQWLDFISNSSFTPALNAACYLRAFGRNDCVEVAFEAAPEGLLIPRAMIANNWMLKGAKNAHQEVGHKRTGIFEQTVGL